MTAPWPQRALRLLLRGLTLLVRLLARGFYLSYIFVFRVAVYALALSFVVYFTVNSSWFNRTLHGAIADALPGAIHIETLQWGPVPWQVRLVGVDIVGPEGDSVIRADEVYAEVDLGALFRWLGPVLADGMGARGALGRPRHTFHLAITAAVVRDFEVVLDFREGVMPHLVWAFTTPDDPDEPEDAPDATDLPTVVLIGEAFGRNGRCVLRWPDLEMVYEGIEFAHGVVRVEPDGTHVRTPVARVGGGHVLLPPELGLPPIEVSALEARRFALYPEHLEVPHAELRVGGSRLRVAGALGFPSEAPTSLQAEVFADVQRDDAVVAALLGDVWRSGAVLSARASGPLRAPRVDWSLLAGAGVLAGLPVEEVVASGALSSEPATGAADAEDVSGWWIEVDQARLGALGGQVRLADAALALPSGDLHGRVMLAGVDPARAADIRGLEGAATSLAPLAGALDGELALGGRLRLDTTGEPELWLTLPGATGLRLTSRWLAGVPAPGQRNGAPRGEPAIEPGHAPLQLFGEVGVRLGETTSVAARPLRAQWGGARATWSGEVDLTRRSLHGSLDVRVPRIDPSWLPELPARVAGATLEGLRLTGPWWAPLATEGRLKFQQVEVGPARFPEVTARIGYGGGELRIDRLTVGGQPTSLSLDATLGVFDGGLGRVSSVLPLTVRRLEGRDVPVAWLWPGGGGVFDVREGSARVELARPLTTLSGRANVSLRELHDVPLPVRSLEASVRAEPDRLEVSSARIHLTRGEVVDLRNVQWRPSRGQVRGGVRASDFDLGHLLAYAGVTAPVTGRLGVDVEFDVGGAAAALSGALRVDELVYDGLELGDAHFTLESLGGGRVGLHAEPFWFDLALLEGSELSLAPSGQPRALTAKVQFDDFDVLSIRDGRRAEAAAPAGAFGTLEPELVTELTAVAEATWRFDGPRAGLALRLDIPDGGARVLWLDGLTELGAANEGPASFTYEPQRGLEIERLVATAQGLRAGVCGQVSPRGELALFAAAEGRLELPDFARGVLSALDASLATESAGVAVPAACADVFAAVGADAIAVRGTIDDPEVRGGLSFDVPTARVRGLPGELALREPGRLVFAQERWRGRRVLALRTHEGEPLRGRYGEGNVDLAGHVLFDGFHLEAVDVHADALNFEWAASQEVRLRVNAALDFRGEGLSSAGASPQLSGDVVIVEGRFGSSPTLGGQLFGGAAGRKLGTTARGGQRAPAWVDATRLDLAATSSNLQMRVALPVGQADLDLRLDVRVRGTIAEPELYGRLEVLPGGMIRNTVLGREFEVRRAALDFSGDPLTPAISAELRAEVTFQESRAPDAVIGTGQIFSAFSSLGAQEKTVGVNVSITGQANLGNPGRELESIEVDLTSDTGTYERNELFTLLVTGVPPGSEGEGRAGAGGGGVVTLFADEIASLLAGTLLGIFIDSVNVGISLTGGLDWALRKSFGRNLQVSVTGFQDSTGQRVEPRFELRLTERLSLEGALRYQQLEQITGQTYEAKLRYRIPLDR